MSPFWWALLGALAGTVAVIALMMWWRRRTLLRIPGTFRAQVWIPGERSRGVSVIGRYNDVGLDLMKVRSIDPRPCWSTARHRAEIRREGEGSRQGTVLARLSGGPETVLLELSHEECSGVSAWIESGPLAGFGIWREDPSRRPRRTGW